MGSPPSGLPFLTLAGGAADPAEGPGAPTLVLLSIVLVAAGVRSHNLVGFPEFTVQEGVSLHLALSLLRGGSVGDVGGSLPPGAALLASLLWLLGFPDRTIATSLTLRGAAPLSTFTVWTFLFIPRMTMVALAAVDTYLIYVLGRRLFHRTMPALAAALFFATAPLGLYTRLVLLDNLGTTLVLGGFVLLMSAPAASRRPRPWYRFGSGVLFGLAMLTTFTALLFLPAILIASAQAHRGSGAPGARGGAALLWTPILISTLAFWPFAFASGSPLPELIPGPSIVVTAGAPAAGLGLITLDPLLIALGALGFLLALLSDRPTLIAWALGALAYFFIAPTPADTLVIPLIPVLALTAGGLVGGASLGRAARRPPHRRGITVGGLIPVLLVAAVLGSQSLASSGPDLSAAQVGALRYTLAVANEGALVISSPAYLWALDAFTNRFTAATWRTPDLERLIASHQQVYLIVDASFLSAVPGNALLGRVHQMARPLASFTAGKTVVEVRGIITYTITARVLFPNGDPEAGSRLRITPSPGGRVAYEGTNLTHVTTLDSGNYTVEAFNVDGSPVGSYGLQLISDMNIVFTEVPQGSPTGVLRITVAFENGDPVHWAAINTTAAGMVYRDRGRDGIYIAELPAGPYALSVSGSHGQPLLARNLSVVAGATQDVTVTEVGLPGTAKSEHDLHVTLVTPQGLGISGSAVQVADDRGNPIAFGRTLFDGTYVVRLKAGTYAITATHSGTPPVRGAPLNLDRDLYVQCPPTSCSVAP